MTASWVLLNILSFSLIWESRLSFMASLGHYSYSSVSCFTPLLISALSCLLVSTPASAEWYMVASRATPRIGAWLWRGQLLETWWLPWHMLQTSRCTQLVTLSTVLCGLFQGSLYTASALLVLQNDSRTPTSWEFTWRKCSKSFRHSSAPQTRKEPLWKPSLQTQEL